jgi:hypothetical protein
LTVPLSAACGVFWDGEFLCVEHQVTRRIWPPDCGVSSDAETVAPDRELEEPIAAASRDRLDRAPRIGTYRPGMRYRSEQRDARAIVHCFRAGRRLDALRACRPLRRTAHGIFSLRVPLPFFCRLTGLEAEPGALPPAG